MPALSMAELLRYHADRDPDRVAICCGDEQITRAELDRLSNRMARAFAAEGVTANDFVTIALPNSIPFLAAAFAAIKIGAIPMPVSHRLAAPERAAILELARPALVLGGGEETAGLTGSVVLPSDWQPDDEHDDGPLPPPPVAETWKAMTSGGSTGRPKIIVSKEPPSYDPFAPPLGMSVDGVQLVPGPLYHQGPFMFSMFGLFTGATIVLMQRFDAQRAIELIEHHRVDWACLVPTMTHRIWRLPEDVRAKADLSSLNVVFSTGSPWPVWLKEAWIDWLGPDRIVEGYGGTESQGGARISGVEALERPGSVGRPSSGLRILDEHGNDVPLGTVGEIYMLPPRGPGSTYRYIGAESRSIDGWETLGDLGYLDEDGYLYLVDRRTDMIVSGGANIYPAEVEAALDRHPAVRSSAVIGLPDDDLGQRVHAIVDIADHPEPSIDELLAHAREHLSPYKIPRTFEIVREPLRDDAGKVRRAGLRAARIEREG